MSCEESGEEWKKACFQVATRNRIQQKKRWQGLVIRLKERKPQPSNAVGIKALIPDRSQTDSFQSPFIDSHSDSYQWLEENDTTPSSPWFPCMKVSVLPGQTLLTHSFISWPWPVPVYVLQLFPVSEELLIIGHVSPYRTQSHCTSSKSVLPR